MRRSSRIAIVFFLSLFLVGVSGTLMAQESQFPTKPITMYMGFPPGGTVGISGQIIAEMLKETLGQPVIANYKPGAQQAVAGAFVAKAKPDGYTLLWEAESDFNNKMIMEGNSLTFKREDFIPIGGTAICPYLLTVKSDAPWKTIEYLIAYGKKNPGELSYGSAGVGAMNHLGVELFAYKTGIKVNHIPFQGGGPALTALLGGHVKITLGSTGRIGSHLKAGTLRGLVVFSSKRSEQFPEVPTFKEKGYDAEIELFHLLLAPKGLEPPVREKLVQVFKKALQMPKYKEMLMKAEFDPSYMSPENVDKRMEKEKQDVLTILKEIGLLQK